MELDSGTLAYTGENAGTLPGKLVVRGTVLGIGESVTWVKD